MRTGAVLGLAERTIKRNCDIRIHRLAAIAMTEGWHLIASATNRAASGQVSDYSLHAEENLVRKLRKINAQNRYKNIVVFVVRLSKTGWRLARPCPRCEGILLGFGVKRVYYTDNRGNIVELK